MASKTSKDLNVKHFSRYGEFLASFELSKRGWNVYTPVYDEYIDLIIHKTVCTKCDKDWDVNPKRICSKCKKEITASKKKQIKPGKICKKCKKNWTGNRVMCQCGSRNIIYIHMCPFCKGSVKLKYYKCECGSRKYKFKFRTIQIKSSRIESRCGSFAIDHDPKDMMNLPEHYFMWVCIDEKDKHFFLVMSVQDFIKTMADSIKGTSWMKDDDRQHFKEGHFGKWSSFLNNFSVLD